jgi:hypothetical protein
MKPLSRERDGRQFVVGPPRKLSVIEAFDENYPEMTLSVVASANAVCAWEACRTSATIPTITVHADAVFF